MVARRHNLNVADKPDSQDICFVPEGKYADVVRKLRPGNIELEIFISDIIQYYY